MIILAIDPGPKQSGYIFWKTGEERPLEFGIIDNDDMLDKMLESDYDDVVIEDIVLLGQTFVGKEVFDTAKWAGRFWEVTESRAHVPIHWINRREVKLNLCETNRAKDKNIRAALIERFGVPGTKKKPGRLYGISGHVWSALALAVTFCDLNNLSPAESIMLQNKQGALAL